MRLKASSLLLIVLLAGCSLAPHYERPSAPVSADWPTGPAYREPTRETGKPAADIAWQDFFVDPQLRQIIALSLENNRDLRVALLNIERSRAQYRIRRSDIFPKVNVDGGYSKRRIPDTSGFGEALTLEQYDLNLGISSYELDLFGRVRSLKEQALEQYLATEEARRSVQITLVADVAAGYLTLAADRERLQVARGTLENQQDAYRLIKSRFDAGVASALELDQAQTSVDAARVDIARFTSLVAQDENALDLLIGARVGADLLPENLSPTVTLKEIAPGLPSEVLLTRPDILQAEHVLKGANANIGAARAAFFPRLTLISSIGTASDELSGLFSGDSEAWSFAPRLTLPIFTAGSNRANLKVSKVDRDIAMARYEKAIQTAFREVADALAVQGTIDEQLAAQESLTRATSESYDLARARYNKGVASYLNVLDAQRSLYGAQQNLIGTRLTRLTNLVTLYKVLGGGSI